jgi:hypothetical protein
MRRYSFSAVDRRLISQKIRDVAIVAVSEHLDPSSFLFDYYLILGSILCKAVDKDGTQGLVAVYHNLPCFGETARVYEVSVGRLHLRNSVVSVELGIA